MLAKVRSCTIIGLEGRPIEVEVDLSDETAALTIVGLSHAAFNESTEDRLRSAIKKSGYLYPSRGSPSTFPLPTYPKRIPLTTSLSR